MMKPYLTLCLATTLLASTILAQAQWTQSSIVIPQAYATGYDGSLSSPSASNLHATASSVYTGANGVWRIHTTFLYNNGNTTSSLTANLSGGLTVTAQSGNALALVGGTATYNTGPQTNVFPYKQIQLGTGSDSYGGIVGYKHYNNVSSVEVEITMQVQTSYHGSSYSSADYILDP